MKKTFHKWTLIMLALLSTLGCGRTSAGNIHHLSAADASAVIEENRENKAFVILDIRTPAEFAQGHIAGAQLLDFRDPGFKSGLQRLDRTKTYLLYCRTGNRTAQALKLIQTLGFNKVYHLKDGIVSWASASLPIEK